jgi:nifR3 family TIM-barrel protein
MASFTNVPFRTVAVRCGSGFTTNEEIDAEALIRGNVTTEQMARPGAECGVVAMQLLGNSAETLVPAALRLVEAGADIIDINMGCPVPKIVRRGKGAALMRDVRGTARILAALRAALGDEVPLTIKIRGGWDEAQPNAVEVARMAQEAGVDGITVHPRTRAQRFGGQSAWDVIADVVRAVEIPVTGNGDVTSLAEARRMMAGTGCASVMVGRAALGRPWLFDAGYECLDAEARAGYETRVVGEHMDLIGATFAPREALVQMKKHFAQYAAGWPHARAFRAELFAQPTPEAARAVYERLNGSAVGARELRRP